MAPAAKENKKAAGASDVAIAIRGRKIKDTRIAKLFMGWNYNFDIL
jgi:hypothetical protein